MKRREFLKFLGALPLVPLAKYIPAQTATDKTRHRNDEFRGVRKTYNENYILRYNGSRLYWRKKL